MKVVPKYFLLGRQLNCDDEYVNVMMNMFTQYKITLLMRSKFILQNVNF